MSDPLNEPTLLSRNRRVGFRREADAERDRLARLLANIPEAIVCCDRDWRITFANAEAVRIVRIQLSDLNSRTHWEIFPESVGTDVESAYREAMETRVAGKIEHFYAPLDVWLEIHILPLDDGITLYFRDMSVRKEAEEHRDAAVDQLQQILGASAESICCIDRHWKCTFANRAALEILKADTLIGENLWERFPSNLEEPFRSNYLKTMEQRVPTEFEAYYPEPLDIWFRVSVRPFEDGIVIFASDITDRKGAELLRDTSMRELRRVLETTTDAVASLDREWNYTYLNRRARELLAPKGDLVGKNLWREFPEVARPDSDVYSHYHRAMDEGIAGEFEVFYPEPLNLWLSLQVRPHDDGIVVFFRDITTRGSRNSSSGGSRSCCPLSSRRPWWRRGTSISRRAMPPSDRDRIRSSVIRLRAFLTSVRSRRLLSRSICR
jgi:PAS domain S-box-containing protein